MVKLHCLFSKNKENCQIIVQNKEKNTFYPPYACICGIFFVILCADL